MAETKEITFKTAGEAQEVLTILKDLVGQKGIATVADLYDLTGNKSDYKDNWQGWLSLNDAYISPTTASETHTLVLPQPVAIKY